MSEKQGKRKAPRSAWKPGQSGNPAGRPPMGKAFAEALRKNLTGEGPAIPLRLAAVAKACVEKALAGDVQALRLLANYHDGLPLQSVNVSESVGINPLDLVSGPLGLDDDDEPAD